MVDSACEIMSEQLMMLSLDVDSLSHYSSPKFITSEATTPAATSDPPFVTQLSFQGGGNEGLGISFDLSIAPDHSYSFLEQVKKEYDQELPEESDESESCVSESLGSSDDPEDHHPTSSVGGLLSLVVGLGATTLMQILK